MDAASLALLAVIGGWWAPSASVVDIEVTIRRMAGAADRRRPNVVSIVLFFGEDELSLERTNAIHRTIHSKQALIFIRRRGNRFHLHSTRARRAESS